MLKRRIFACIVAAVIAMGVASPAMAADLHSHVTGGHTWRDSGKATAAIKDTKGNNRHVYMKYRRSGDSSDRTLSNKSGDGATVRTGSGKRVTGLKACESIPVLPDECDGWKK